MKGKETDKRKEERAENGDERKECGVKEERKYERI